MARPSSWSSLVLDSRCTGLDRWERGSAIHIEFRHKKIRKSKTWKMEQTTTSTREAGKELIMKNTSASLYSPVSGLRFNRVEFKVTTRSQFVRFYPMKEFPFDDTLSPMTPFLVVPNWKARIWTFHGPANIRGSLQQLMVDTGNNIPLYSIIVTDAFDPTLGMLVLTLPAAPDLIKVVSSKTLPPLAKQNV